MQNAESRRPALARGSPARLKLAVAFLIIFSAALLPRRVSPWYLIPLAVVLLLWPLCRMPITYAWRRLLMAEFFILGLALLSFLAPSSAPVFLAAIVKSNLCIFTLLLLTWSTPFHEILQVLRELKLPTVMLTTLALMYRYLPVLSEESRRMQRARASRTFRSSRRLAWENLTTILGHLFIRTTERAERIYLAMCSRGWK